MFSAEGAICFKLYADLSFRLLHRKELAPSLQQRRCKGCQGFIGPYPSAFLDKYIKELECKDIRRGMKLPKFFYLSKIIITNTFVILLIINDKNSTHLMFARTILSGKFGRITVNFLRAFKAFNKHFVVVSLGNSFMILRKASKDQLREIEITTDNILFLKFDFHLTRVKEYLAEIIQHDFDNKNLLINLSEYENKERVIKQFKLKLTEETNFTLKELLDKKVFKHKYGVAYKYFISVGVSYKIKKAKNNDRQFSEATLLYTLKHLSNGKELGLKSKLAFSKEEAITFLANVSYWKDC